MTYDIKIGKPSPVAAFAVAVCVTSVVGFAYALPIMWFWNLLVCKVLPCASRITYMESYLAYLFFVVLPKIMPIRVAGNAGRRDA